MKFLHSSPLAATLIAAAVTAQAQEINYEVIAHAHNIDVEAIVGSGNYKSVDGIALGPLDTVIAVHATTGSVETFVSIDPEAETGSAVKTDAQAVADLGTPYGPSLIFASGMDSDLTAGALYFVDTFNGEYALLSMDLNTYAVSEVLRSIDLFESEDLAVLPTGEVLLVRGTDGIGVVDPAATTPGYSQLITMAQIQSVLGTSEPAPAEAIAVNPSNGDVYVFCHDVLALLKIEDILATPVITEIPTEADYDFHDLVVDGNGIVYGFNEAHSDKSGDHDHGSGENAIIIIDPEDGHSHVYTMDAIVEALEDDHHHDDKHGSGDDHDHEHGEFAVTLWRGMAVTATADEAKLFLASAVDEFGLVMLEFTNEATNAPGWELYH